MSDRRPLYGHTSEANAYYVDDYPYGFSLRTKIRYWLECKETQGWRFVSQTLNPKTDRWNKPKAATYSDWGGVMYLDEKGHVHWDGIGPYTDEAKILAFVKAFPAADMRMLRKIVPAKIKFLNDMISGARYFTVNGQRVARSEADDARNRAELRVWVEIEALLTEQDTAMPLAMG